MRMSFVSLSFTFEAGYTVYIYLLHCKRHKHVGYKFLCLLIIFCALISVETLSTVNFSLQLYTKLNLKKI